MEPAGPGAHLSVAPLERRPSRPPDHRLEAELLVQLASTLAERPERLAQQICDLLVERGLAHSAGLGISSESDRAHRFRQVALAGKWRPHPDLMFPNAEPWCQVVAYDRPLLLDHPERYFWTAGDGTSAREALLVPFHHGVRAAGVIWLLSHEEQRDFDSEDLRLLQSLSRFASAACRMNDVLRRAAATEATGRRAQAKQRRSQGSSQADHQSAERQKLLVAELQHRVRNMLSIVRYLFSRTVESSADIEEAAMHFKGRLDALARTQVIVGRNPSGLVDLEAMIRDELLSVGQGDSLTLVIDGPPVELDPVSAENIALAIHELTMNAIKFGAFKVPDATLEIRWAVRTSESARPTLNLSWIETGVPIVPVVGQQDGFGKELIERALPYRLGAEARLETRGGGVRCFISTPIDACGGTSVFAEAPDA